MIEPDKTLKWVWAYLLRYGVVTTGDWSYYGCEYEPVEGWNFVSWEYGEEFNKTRAEFINKVIDVGIDWHKTTSPYTENNSFFEDSFATQSSYKLCTLGKLWLKNGEMFKVGSSKDEAATLAKVAK